MEILPPIEILNKDVYNKRLLEYGEYSKIKEDNISHIQIIYTIPNGEVVKEISDEKRIGEEYRYLRSKKLAGRTLRSCKNTLDYIKAEHVIDLKNGKQLSIKLECNTVIIKNKRYRLK